MRFAFAFPILVMTAAVANAQQQPVGPPASIGLPLPPIGLPLPIIGLQPNEPAPPVASPSVPRPGRPQHPAPPAIVVFGAPPVFGYEAWQLSPMPGVIAKAPEAPAPELRAPRPPEETGQLRLDVKPGDAQLFVDGEFVGTLIDAGGELELRPGTRRIEIRAPRHEALSFDARIVAGRTITYRGSLTRIEEPPRRSAPPPSTPPTSATQPVEKPTPTPASPPPARFYLIPGCYLGNVPPDQVKLPAGCDLGRVITHTPAR